MPQTLAVGRKPSGFAAPDGLRRSAKKLGAAPDGLRRSAKKLGAAPDGLRRSAKKLGVAPDGLCRSAKKLGVAPDGLRRSAIKDASILAVGRQPSGAANHSILTPTMPSPNDAQPWYADGLRFECTQCGLCCGGDPGVVWVDDREIAELAEAVDLTAEQFTAMHVRRVGGGRSLREHPNGDCTLLDPATRKCSAYHVRPVQCRTWPFWDSTLHSPDSWAETCRVCPGAGTGTLVPIDQIEIQRRKRSV